jgi:hypothetical protein
MQNFTVAGVPRSLAQDGWWIDPPQPEVQGREARGRRGWVLLGLVVLGDVLFWRQAGPGVSLAVFLLALALVLRGAGTLARRDWGLVGVVVCLLPLVERVQALSVGFALAGVLGFGLWLRRGAVADVLRLLPALPRLLPLGFRDGVAELRALRGTRADAGRWARALALPLGLGLCFAGLLIAANPVLAEGLDGFGWHDPARGLFWGGLALILWPVMALPRAEMAETQFRGPGWRFGGVVNLGAVTSSLWLFNAMFAVQSVMDAAFLWGGATLPAGMSHASYAHRGAYPLVVTALLAGLFALISRPYAAESRVLRALLLAWIGQNLLLTASALLRLQAYVEAYGLTYLRISAAIWMGLVALGLALVAWAVWRGRGNGWLALRAAGLGVGVLYACCFVNFAEKIAAGNLAAAAEGRLAYGLDLAYLCELGPDGWAPMDRAGAAAGCAMLAIDLNPPAIEGWRDWSYRSARILAAKGEVNADFDRRR